MIYTYYTYILASKPFGTLYIGVTNDIEQRLIEHKEGRGSTFAYKYKIFTLVYYEEHDDVRNAIDREKQLKSWRRQWKMNLINVNNPRWEDLAQEWAEVVDERIAGS